MRHSDGLWHGRSQESGRAIPYRPSAPYGDGPPYLQVVLYQADDLAYLQSNAPFNQWFEVDKFVLRGEMTGRFGGRITGGPDILCVFCLPEGIGAPSVMTEGA